MKTLKIRYSTTQESLDVIDQYQKQYSVMLRVMYNRFADGKLTENQIKHFQINNIPLMNSWFRQTAVKEAAGMYSKDKESQEEGKNHKRIFGGKKNFMDIQRGLISKEEYQKNRVMPLCSIGEKRTKANRLFRISDCLGTITFQPNKRTKIQLTLTGVGKNRLPELVKLHAAQVQCSHPITYKLCQEYVYISFDPKLLMEECSHFKPVANRILSIDKNPNYIGYTVIDWHDPSDLRFTIIERGVITLKTLNDQDFALKSSSDDPKKTHITNKRRHEIFEISKWLVDLAKHYQCEIFAIEQLVMPSKDNKKGRNYNRLINNMWNRDRLVSNLKTRCDVAGIRFLEMYPQYSSFFGNILYRSLENCAGLPDMVLSAVEIGRRAAEFNLQYIKKTKGKVKNIIFPTITQRVKKAVLQTLEVLNVSFDWEGEWRVLYDYLKNSKIKYRVSMDPSIVFRQKHLRYSCARKHFGTA